MPLFRLPYPGKTDVVSLRVDNADPDEKLTYKWSASTGEIIEGQGTTSIKLRITDLSHGITATVEVGGLPGDDCDKRVSCSFNVF